MFDCMSTELRSCRQGAHVGIVGASGLVGEFMRSILAEREAPGFAFVVRSMTIDFRKPARMDDVLDIVTAYAEVKGASILLDQRVLRGDELLVAAQVRVAFVCDGRARPIPKPLRLAMRGEQDRAAR